MSKHRKKRNKPYSGADAAASKGPVVHHYVAVERSPWDEWWHEHKRTVKITSIIAGGGTALVWFLYEATRVILAR